MLAPYGCHSSASTAERVRYLIGLNSFLRVLFWECKRVYISPVSHIPIALAVIAVMAKNLKVVDIQGQAWPELPRFDMVYIHHSPCCWRCTATHTFGPVLLEGLHPDLAPLKGSQEAVLGILMDCD
jgi:hypothetical protein